jgi:hypothetical protein
LAQSLALVQLQRPALSPAPHATQLLSLHSLPIPQSAFVEQATGAPASSPGGRHWPLVQTVPFGQLESVLQVGTQEPPVVQM